MISVALERELVSLARNRKATSALGLDNLRSIFFVGNYDFIRFERCETLSGFKPDHILAGLIRGLIKAPMDQQQSNWFADKDAAEQIAITRPLLLDFLMGALDERCLVLDIKYTLEQNQAAEDEGEAVVKHDLAGKKDGSRVPPPSKKDEYEVYQRFLVVKSVRQKIKGGPQQCLYFPHNDLLINHSYADFRDFYNKFLTKTSL